MRNILGYNWTDYKTNIEILNKIKLTSVIKKKNVYKSKPGNDMNIMLHNRIFEKNTPKERRSPGRSMKK